MITINFKATLVSYDTPTDTMIATLARTDADYAYEQYRATCDFSTPADSIDYTGDTLHIAEKIAYENLILTAFKAAHHLAYMNLDHTASPADVFAVNPLAFSVAI